MYHKKGKALGMKGLKVKKKGDNEPRLKDKVKAGTLRVRAALKDGRARGASQQLDHESLSNRPAHKAKTIARLEERKKKSKEKAAELRAKADAIAPKRERKKKADEDRIFKGKVRQTLRKAESAVADAGVKAAEKLSKKMPGGGKMPMYMAGGKIYKDGGSLMQALLKDPKQRARAKKIMGL